MKLVIVESPTKAATIGRFLGKSYEVESSYGHVRDLPKSKLGIDVEKDFEPSYVIPTKVRKRVNELKKLSVKAEEVILATDEDREGEAIAWHLARALGLDEKATKRIVFHEITKRAIEEALTKPRGLDRHLVDAQQARRVLDRLVGYKLSPFLWKKVFRGLSAGRVQSAALRLIVDREKEIAIFRPEEYWSITAALKKIKGGENFSAELAKRDGKPLEKLGIGSKEEAEAILADLDGARYQVGEIKMREVKRTPAPPFTTSTLQQEAANRLRFSAKQTMMVAQSLYEEGHITYMRTDSVNLSGEALAAAGETIARLFGPAYVLETPRRFATKAKGAQEAHEAVRPTDPSRTPEMLSLEPRVLKLYTLIWRRFMASQMPEAVFAAKTVFVEANGKKSVYILKATGSTLVRDGFLKIYPAKVAERLLPPLESGEALDLSSLTPAQHFTEPPPRYSEATLVKALEEFGIGRPSTYAPIISTLRARNYVEKNIDRRFVPTETGAIVSNLLVEHFPSIVDIGFTAKMEDELDKIAEEGKDWRAIIRAFYDPFENLLLKKYASVERTLAPEEKTDEVCEKCGRPMVVKRGRFGKFMACSGFPDCKNTKTIKEPPKTIGMTCPDCLEGEVIIKHSKRGRMFFGCSRYPACTYASWKNPKGVDGQKEK